MTATTLTLEGNQHHEVARSSEGNHGPLEISHRDTWGPLQTLVGGTITLLTELWEKTREEAFTLMLTHAEMSGGNAVAGIQYNATKVMSGVTEVLCYGTAVVAVRG